jgi:hypothetical protein
MGCASNAPAAAPETPVDAEPVVIEWSIGPKGGLGEGSAFITQASWEPKKLEVPANQAFIIRFVPRDDRTDTIVFGTSLEQEVGMELEDLVVKDGQPAETPVLLIKSPNKAFDVFSREHRGVGGFGSIVTAAE